MGALDDAIREHLELKRRQGASDEEIRQAEAEALGPARREPTSVPGETPGVAEEPIAPAPVPGTEAVDDVPPPPPPEPAPYVGPDPGSPSMEPHPVEPPPVAEVLVEHAPVEHAAVEQAPVEPHPVEPAPAGEPPVAHAPVEPAPVEPPPVVEHPEEPPPSDDPDRTRTAILDDPMDDLALPNTPPAPPVHHEPGPDEPPAPARPIEPESRDHGAQHSAPAAPSGEEDVLEETPDFLQETPEHDRLWFEQKPPRDFDFDD